MAQQARARLLELFRDRAVSFGRFTLASGKESSYYINSKKALFNSEAVALLAEMLWDMTKDLNIQAIGGLYDPITLGAFPEPMRAAVLKTLPALTTANFCDSFRRERHAPPNSSAAVVDVDRMRNVDPKVLKCDVSGDTVTFDKEVSFAASSPRQYVYGAVRFLAAPYSTFQLIRATAAAPPPAMLIQITELVNSWKPRAN